MIKQYSPNVFLKLQDSRLYAIFAWGQRPAEIIILSSWVALLEIFVHEHSLDKAYKIFQKINTEYNIKTKNSLIEYKFELLKSEDSIIFLGDGILTIFGRGFRSFIEKEMQFELAEISQDNPQILLQLFPQEILENDLDSIRDKKAFESLVYKLESLGFLSPVKGTINWGDLKREYPICQAFGLTRGTPIDRYYLGKFINEIKGQIGGNILEIGGTPKDKDFYQINSGTSYRILNLEAGPGVDIVGDVHDPSIIEPESFDSIIIFNVLEHCYAPWIAVENIYKWLKVGGECFAMVPNAIRVHATPMDYWRPLPDAFAWMFRNFSQRKLYVYGNPMTVIASYHGIAVEEMSIEELDAFHPDYPVANCIVAQK
jgi:SAM-dependent methyltransferase